MKEFEYYILSLVFEKIEHVLRQKTHELVHEFIWRLFLGLAFIQLALEASSWMYLWRNFRSKTENNNPKI